MAKPTMNTVSTANKAMYNVVSKLEIVSKTYKMYRREVYHKRNRRVSNYVYRHRSKLFTSDNVLWRHRIRIYKNLYKYKALVPQHEITYTTLVPQDEEVFHIEETRKVLIQ